MVERIEIRGGITSEGEPITEFRTGEGEPLGFVVGEGENVRGATLIGEWRPKHWLVEGFAASEEAGKGLFEEMEKMGARRINIGLDSPDLRRSHGWSGRIWDENYPKIFGHD